jgi:hypothetical protein
MNPRMGVVDLRELSMSEPSKLRHRAAQCLERAQAITDPQVREAWLQTALGWLRLAGTNERQFSSQQQQQIQSKRHDR